jgi:uncharacterized membrane protein
VLHASPIYDRVVYFSFLTVVPGMAVFLLKLETAFARRTELFVQHVLRKGTLSQVSQYKNEMIVAFQDGFSALIKLQGLCTIMLILSANRILPLLGLGAVQTGIYQICLLGAFVLVLFLSLLTTLFYLDKRFDALMCTCLFAGVNALVTAVAIQAGERWYGFGFLAAGVVGTAFAAMLVNRRLQNLDYDTFTSQPLYG